MELLKSLIYYLAFASLGFSAIAAYLKINKIWKRRHLRDVAESVSITGNAIDVIPLSVFALNYMFVSQWQGLIDSSIWIGAGIVLILIGAGIWVQEGPPKSLWKLIKDAVRLERKEAGELARALFKPSSKRLAFDILKRIAFIDKVLDEREKEFIQVFADSWDIQIDWDQIKQEVEAEDGFSHQSLHEALTEYLQTSPSHEQVKHFADIIIDLVNADNIVTEEEKLALDEIRGLFTSYMDKDNQPPGFSVVIVPQTPEQEATIQSLRPDIHRQNMAGGFGYVIGSFFSSRYAEVVCNQYQAMDLFTVSIGIDDIKKQHWDAC